LIAASTGRHISSSPIPPPSDASRSERRCHGLRHGQRRRKNHAGESRRPRAKSHSPNSCRRQSNARRRRAKRGWTEAGDADIYASNKLCCPTRHKLLRLSLPISISTLARPSISGPNPATATAADRRFGPGAFRLFLASVVVLQHASLLALGAWAVFVFFILSGYWVTAMWEESYQRCRAPYLTFMVSRYWRLLPIYLACHGFMFALYWFRSPFWPEMLEHWGNPAWAARVLLILTSSLQPTSIPPTWSLDVEVQFYFMLPLLAVLVARCAGRKGALRVAAFSALYAASAAAFFFCRLGQFTAFFLVGMTIWKLRWNPAPRWAVASAASFLVVVAVLWCVPATHPWVSGAATHTINRDFHAKNQILCVALALLVIPFTARNVHVPTSGLLDRHLGNLAYAVYLFHYLVQFAVELMITHRGWPQPLILALDFALVAAGSVALYWFIDRPIDALRRRWVKARRVLK
jgi:peptidoglycan/LPS O-acetylase OafA/YrhL